MPALGNLQRTSCQRIVGKHSFGCLVWFTAAQDRFSGKSQTSILDPLMCDRGYWHSGNVKYGFQNCSYHGHPFWQAFMLIQYAKLVDSRSETLQMLHNRQQDFLEYGKRVSTNLISSFVGNFKMNASVLLWPCEDHSYARRHLYIWKFCRFSTLLASSFHSLSPTSKSQMTGTHQLS